MNLYRVDTTFTVLLNYKEIIALQYNSSGKLGVLSALQVVTSLSHFS